MQSTEMTTAATIASLAVVVTTQLMVELEMTPLMAVMVLISLSLTAIEVITHSPTPTLQAL